LGGIGEDGRRAREHRDRPRWPELWLALTTIAMLVGAGYFLFDRPAYVANAHLAAASALFVGLIAIAGASFFAFRGAKAAGSVPARNDEPTGCWRCRSC
jgi:heme A synthase